jgi:hypothetical protein
MGGGASRYNPTTSDFWKRGAAVGAMLQTGEDMYKGITGQTAAKQMKEVSDEAAAREQKATAELQASQATASSQAAEVLKKRKAISSKSTNIFTSPLGLSGTATTARKTLLGQ